MDPTTFDHIVAASATTPTRRAALAVLIGGAVALVTGQGTDADQKAKGKGIGKRKPKPKPKGCTKSQKKCGDKCIPFNHCCTTKDCVYCNGEVCETNGTCRCKVGTSDFNGVCSFKPNCLPVPFIGGPGPSACCSGNAIIEQDGGNWVCVPGTKNCYTDFDCKNGPLPGRCRGFMCPELYQQVFSEYGCP